MKIFNVLFVSAVLACLLMPLTGIAQTSQKSEQQDVKEKLLRYLAQQKLRLASNGETAARKFHFTVSMELQGDNGMVGGVITEVECNEGHIGLLVTTRKGLPWMIAADNISVIPDRTNPGNLVVGTAGSTNVEIRGDDKGTHISWMWEKDERASVIDLDIKSILLGAIKEATNIEFHEGIVPFYVLKTQRTELRLECNNLPDAGFAVSKLIFQGRGMGSRIVIYDIGVNEPPIRSAIGLTRQKINELGVTARDHAPTDHSFAVPPSDYPDGVLEKAIGQKLSKLVPEDPVKVAAYHARAIIEAVGQLEKSVGLISETESNVRMSRLRSELVDVTVREAVIQHKPGVIFDDWRYDRGIVAENMRKEFTIDGAKQIVKSLAAISSNPLAPLSMRVIALDSLGDIGFDNNLDLIKQTETVLEASTDNRLRVTLASVKARLERKIDDRDKSLLQAQLLNRDQAADVRFRCLEALCIVDALDKSSREAILNLLDTVNLKSRTDAERQSEDGLDWASRGLTSLGYCAAGRETLLAAVRGKEHQDWNENALRTLRGFIGRDDANWPQMVNLTKDILHNLDNKEGLLLGAVAFLSSQALDNATIDEFVNRACRSPREKDVRLGCMTISLGRRAFDSVDALAIVLDRPEVELRQQAMLAMRGEKRDLSQCPQGLMLVTKALDDKADAVRATAMLVVSDQFQKFQWKPKSDDEIIRKIIKLAQASHDLAELRNSIAIVEELSTGKFRLEGAPRLKSGILSNFSSTDDWWKANSEKARDQALTWAKSHGYMESN